MKSLERITSAAATPYLEVKCSVDRNQCWVETGVYAQGCTVSGFAAGFGILT